MDCRKEFRDIEKVYKYPKEEIKAHVIKCGGLHCSAIGQTCFSSALLSPALPTHIFDHIFAQTWAFEPVAQLKVLAMECSGLCWRNESLSPPAGWDWDYLVVLLTAGTDSCSRNVDNASSGGPFRLYAISIFSALQLSRRIRRNYNLIAKFIL